MTASIRVSTLPNGLRVATDFLPEVETVSIGLWTKVGARQEIPEINGLAHLLEHMLFKGTPTRNARQIAEEIENVGGHMNAYTGRETTAYYARVLKEDAFLALDVISDMVQHSLFDEKELAREKLVVLQEIGQVQDTPDDIVYDNFQSAAFPGQALGRPILGSTETVSNMPRQAFVDWIARHYSAPNLVLAAAGNMDHDDLVKKAEKLLPDLPAATPRKTEPFAYVGGERRDIRDLEQTHLVVGFKGVGWQDPDYHAALVLSALLGGGMSSRLFQEIREKRGLVYAIQAFSQSFTDGGLFGVYAGTDPARVGELIPVLCDEICKAAQDITDAETSRARAQLKASLLMALESTHVRCEKLAQQLHLFGRTIPVDETISKINAVDAAAVMRAARRLREAPPTVSVVGPADNLESHEQITARLKV